MLKKISIIIIISAFLLLFCSCDKISDSKELSTDNDEIVALIEKSPSITSGNLKNKAAYNSNGNIVITYTNTDDYPVEEYVWNNDELLSHTVMQYNEYGQITTKEEISEDGKSNIVYLYMYKEDSVISSSKSTYENGKLVRTDTFNENNELTEYKINTYSDGNIVKTERFNSNNDLLGYSEYEYNNKNLLSKHSTYSADGELESYSTIEYNDKSQRISEKYFNSNSQLQSNYITDYYDTGEIKSMTVYDSDGNITSQENYQQ